MRKNKNFIMFMYAMGYLGISIFTQTTVKWYQYFYTPPEGNKGGLQILVPVGMIGLAMVIARIFDGISDPLVAYYSDKTKSRLGRRIPFVLFGSLPLALTFILLWFPPVNHESTTNFIYLTAMLSLFFIFFTIVVAPYLALINEMSKTNSDRIKLTTMQGLTQIIGVMAAEAGSGVVMNLYGFRTMGIVMGTIAFLSLILTPIFVKEDLSLQDSVPAMGLLESIKLTLKNRNFAFYLVSYISVWFGINTLTITMPYIAEVLLGVSAEYSGYMIAGAFIAALLCMPFLPKITVKYGKKKVLMMTSVLFALILFLTGFFGVVLPLNISFAIVILAGIPLSVIFVIPNAMIADIAELDSIEKGLRREGMFFGAQGLVIKIVIGLSSFVTPLLFGLFGYSSARHLGIQLGGPIAAAAIMIGLIFLKKYSISY
ncbi:MFS transporter [Lutispora saccharofermentans]|uniref:MFS transporter n=1 Tax=Lutispora saccharofermentans TaxID=3024236 RepID=A0ABT1NK39_9FIRM|nr:MFS transporter [Lutispora saccharofermentans]MCQ1531629.1 MFS transporter [Lutispora saccharofermentans]